jgi:crossover junction endodeoxyribonuclease RuvC
MTINNMILSIDPGLKGGICYGSYPENLRAIPMPLIGGEIYPAAIAQLIKEINPNLAIVEKVHSMPGQGVASTFKFGKGYGLVLGILGALGVPIELTTPQAWKKLVLAGTSKDKQAAIAFCAMRYPHLSLIPKGCRTPHDGIADAVCLWSFGYAKQPAGLAKIS